MNTDTQKISREIKTKLSEIDDISERVDKILSRTDFEHADNSDEKLATKHLQIMLTVFAETIPFPCWVKNSNSVIIWANAAYRSKYGDNIAQTDSEFWDRNDLLKNRKINTASGFRINDEKALSGETVLAVEDVSGEQLFVCKWGLVFGNEKAEFACGVGPFVLKP